MNSRCLRVFIKMAVFCLLLGLTAAPETRGEDIPEVGGVLAFGKVKVVGENVAAARKSAISQALEKGVEYYIAGRLEGQAIERNFRRIVRIVIPRAQEGVLNFNVLAEDKVGDEYAVLLRVKINEEIVGRRLQRAGVFLEKVPPLKVLVMVSESARGEIRYWWATPENMPSLTATEVAFSNLLEKMGFSPVNRSMIPNTGVSNEISRSLELSNAEVLKWGRLYSADVIIYGRAEVKGGKKLDLRIEAFDVEQGRRIFQGREEKELGATGGEKRLPVEAIEEAFGKMAGSLGRVMVREAAGSGGNLNQLEVALGNVQSFRQFKIFRDFLLEEVEGVKSVRQSRIEADSLSIQVEFEGDRSTFRNRVEGHDVLPFPVRFEETPEGEMLVRFLVQ